MRTLMTGRTPPELPIWARLVLDLDELSRVEWATLELYAVVRGIKTREAARRNLYRVKATLADFGVELVVKERRRGVEARFATQALADLLEPDFRAARAILERLEARRQGREPDLEWLARETGVLNPATISIEYRGRGKSFAWIARKHGVGKGRLRRILVSTGPIRAPSVKRRVEERRPVADLARALDAADRGASLEEIAATLGCSRRSARRFLARHGRSRATGRPARVEARDGKATFPEPAKPRGEVLLAVDPSVLRVLAQLSHGPRERSEVRGDVIECARRLLLHGPRIREVSDTPRCHARAGSNKAGTALLELRRARNSASRCS